MVHDDGKSMGNCSPYSAAGGATGKATNPFSFATGTSLRFQASSDSAETEQHSATVKPNQSNFFVDELLKETPSFVKTGVPNKEGTPQMHSKPVVNVGGVPDSHLNIREEETLQSMLEEVFLKRAQWD